MAVNVKVESKEDKEKEEQVVTKSVDELTEEEINAMTDDVNSAEENAPEVEVEVVEETSTDKEEEKPKDKVKVEINSEKEEKQKDAKGFIEGLLNYITNPNFEKKIVDQSQKSGLSKRQVANNFAMKILGTISDVIHLGLDTAQDLFSTLISILAGILLKGGELVVRCAKRITRIVTLNQTAKCVE